jgi:hypothetical protein
MTLDPALQDEVTHLDYMALLNQDEEVERLC